MSISILALDTYFCDLGILRDVLLYRCPRQSTFSTSVFLRMLFNIPALDTYDCDPSIVRDVLTCPCPRYPLLWPQYSQECHFHLCSKYLLLWTHRVASSLQITEQITLVLRLSVTAGNGAWLIQAKPLMPQSERRSYSGSLLSSNCWDASGRWNNVLNTWDQLSR